jgi:hypothetical protein
MTPSPLKASHPLHDHDPGAHARLIISHVRMTITQNEGVQTLAVPATVHKILTSIRAVDDKTVFTDVMNKPFTLETFPSDKAKFDASFGTVIKEGRTTKVILGFTITSATTFGKLKQAIMPVLQRCSTFMRPHLSTSWKSLDTITIGHLHLLHPTFADTDELRRKMDQQLTDTAIRLRDNPEFHDILAPHLKRDGTLRVPEIMFYPGRAMGKLNSEPVASDVIDVYVARTSAAAIKYLLEASTENTTRPLAVVPRDFKYNQPDIYAKLLSAQNDYLETHRNIGLVAIPNEAMHSQKVKDIDGREWHSMHAALCHAPGIAAVHCSKRVFDLGKWNISTTQDSWDAVKKWLDHQLLPLYHSIPAEVRDNYKTYADFIEPHRLQYKPPQNGRSDISELSEYAQRIQTQMLGNTTAPRATHHQPPAWKAKRPKLVWTFNEEDFPPITAPVRKSKHDDLSTGSTTTTNSLTTMSTHDGDSIKQLQAQWKKQKVDLETNFHTKLKTMDTTVKTVLERMDSIESRIDTKMEEMELKLTSVIVEKLNATTLVSQVSAVMGGENSPFVTSASLDLAMTNWFAKVNTRLDALLPVLPEHSVTPRSRKKRHSAQPLDAIMDDGDPDHVFQDARNRMDDEIPNICAEQPQRQPADTN